MITYRFMPKKASAPKGKGYVRIEFDDTGDCYAHTEEYSSRAKAVKSTLSVMSQTANGEARLI